MIQDTASGVMKLLRLPEKDELRDAFFPKRGPRRLSLQVHWTEPAEANGVPDHINDASVRKHDTLEVELTGFLIEEGPGGAELLKVRGKHNGRRIMAGWIPSTGENQVEYEEIT